MRENSKLSRIRGGRVWVGVGWGLGRGNTGKNGQNTQGNFALLPTAQDLTYTLPKGVFGKSFERAFQIGVLDRAPM